MESSDNKTYCAIITKEGRAYNEEGLAFVRSSLVELFDADVDDLTVVQGALYNEPLLFKIFLEYHPNTYIVLSLPDNVKFLAADGKQGVINSMETAKELGHTTWRALCILSGYEPYDFPE